MAEFNRKKKTYKKYIYSPLGLAILFLLFLVFVKALWGVYAKERMSAGYLNREQAELSRVLERKNELAQAVEYLKTDQGVEAEMRSKFRMVKEGEFIAVIVGDEKLASTTAATSTAASSPGFWKRFFGF